MTLIIGISGKKSAGKDTAANYITGTIMQRLDIIQKSFVVNEDTEGKLWIADLYGDTGHHGFFDLRANSPEVQQFYVDHLAYYYGLYSYADMLKAMAIAIMGLEYEQCYGTDEQKNSFTKYRWQDMPGVSFSNEQGNMTAREVLQYVGTDIFRRMNQNIWVDATIRQIKANTPKLAVITDVRFPNEVEAIKKEGGIVIRLTRNVLNDEHASEKILDEDQYDWSNFNYIIHNQMMTIEETSIELTKILNTVFPKGAMND